MRSQCLACLSDDVSPLEEVSSEDLAVQWARFYPAAERAIRRYTSSGEMPAVICMHRCADCGLEFADPQFAGDGDWYAAVPHHADRWEHSRCLEDLAGRPRRIVELGCSAGHFLELARAQGHVVTGVDFDESALEIARAKGLDVHSSDLADAHAWWPERVDAVVMFQVLEHITDLDAFIAALARAMAPETALHLSSPNVNRIEHRAERVGLREMWDYPPHHQTRWPRSALEALLARHGFSLTHYEEEFVPVRDLAVALVRRDAVRDGRDLTQVARSHRRLLTLRKMIWLGTAARGRRGGSFYASARRAGPTPA